MCNIFINILWYYNLIWTSIWAKSSSLINIISYNSVVQVMQKQVAGEGASANDGEVIDQLDRRNLKELQSGLNHAKVKGGEKIKTPDQKAPEAELQRQRIGKGVIGLAGKNLEVDHGKHQQAHVEPRGKQYRQKRHQRHGGTALDAGIAVTQYQ